MSIDPSYLALIDECHHGQFAAAALRVTQQLKRTDGAVTPQIMAAHLALRQAQFPKAQWLIDAALAKDPMHQGIYVEELLYTFTQNDYKKQKGKQPSDWVRFLTKNASCNIAPSISEWYHLYQFSHPFRCF